MLETAIAFSDSPSPRALLRWKVKGGRAKRSGRKKYDLVLILKKIYQTQRTKTASNKLVARMIHSMRPRHFLNFFPLPQGQGSFRPTLASALVNGIWGPQQDGSLQQSCCSSLGTESVISHSIVIAPKEFRPHYQRLVRRSQKPIESIERLCKSGDFYLSKFFFEAKPSIAFWGFLNIIETPTLSSFS